VYYDSHCCGLEKGKQVISDETSFDQWITFGIEKGWCGPPVCETHDGVPMSPDEELEFDEGSDPCLHIVRLFHDKVHQSQTTENHSPSQWRNHYTDVRFGGAPDAGGDAPHLRLLENPDN